MNSSSTFLECFHKAKTEVNERLHDGDANRSVDQQFDMFLHKTLDTYGDRFSWCEIVPAVMSPSFIVAANKDSSSIGVKKDAEEANMVNLAKLNAARESSNSDDDEPEVIHEGVNPVRVIAVNCLAPGCRLSFPTYEHMTDHLKDVHRIFKHRCLALPGCKYSVENVSRLVRHIKKYHGGMPTIWRCSKCPERFEYPANLISHLELWHVSGRYACSKRGCPFESQYREPVREHFQIHLKDAAAERLATLMHPRSVPQKATQPVEPSCKYSIKRLNCFVKNCFTFFSEVDEFHRHLKDNHKIKPFMCLVGGCKDRFYDSIEELGLHVCRLHGDVTTWVCHLCHQVFVDHPTLRKHIHCFHEEGLFACIAPGCTMTAQYRANVVMHYEEQHRTASQNVASS